MPTSQIKTHTNKKAFSPQQHRPRTRSPSPVAHHPTAIIQRARAAPESLSAADALQLQRTIGNQAVGRLLAEIGRIPPTGQQAPVQRQGPEEEELLQGKMTEAIQRQPEPEEEELLQGKFTDECVQCQMPEEEEELIQGKYASGLTGTLQAKPEAPPNKTGMPDLLKSGLENISGRSMDDVKVHYNSFKPQQLNALAYTQRQDIYLTAGQEKHLPHEGWHAVQQMQGRVKPTLQANGLAINDDHGLEIEADVMGTRADEVGQQVAQKQVTGYEELLQGMFKHNLANKTKTAHSYVLQRFTLRDSTINATAASEARARARDANPPKFPHRSPNSTFTDTKFNYTSISDGNGYVDFTNNSGTYGDVWNGINALEVVNLTAWTNPLWLPGSKGTRYRHKTMANVLASNYMDGDGHTWHHTWNSGELQLIETNVHGAHPHIGGFSQWGSSY